MMGYELVLLEEGERAALQAYWAWLFTTPLGSSRYSAKMNMFLAELDNVINYGKVNA